MTIEQTRDEREIHRRTAQGLAYAWGRNDQGYRDEHGGMADSWAFTHYYLSVTGGGNAIQDVWEAWLSTSRMTDAQRRALSALCQRYRVAFAESAFVRGGLGLPSGYVSGRVGPIYVGCDPNGVISS